MLSTVIQRQAFLILSTDLLPPSTSMVMPSQSTAKAKDLPAIAGAPRRFFAACRVTGKALGMIDKQRCPARKLKHE